MRNPKLVALVVLVAGLAVVGTAVALRADEGAEHSAKLREVLKQVKVKLVDAVATAEKATGGTAVRAQLEVEGDELSYEVLVVVVKGDATRLREVDVDARTGRIEDDDDEPGDRDDGDGEDDDHDDGEDD